MLTEQQDLALDDGDDGGLVVGPAVLEDVLDDVVAVLVLNQPLRVLVQLLQDRSRLLLGAVLQDPLDHATPVRMRGQSEHLAVKEIES